MGKASFGDKVIGKAQKVALLHHICVRQVANSSARSPANSPTILKCTRRASSVRQAAKMLSSAMLVLPMIKLPQ